MTEKNYRISIFNEKFERFREKRIVLYGIGNNTQAILKHYGTEYNFIGVTTENAKGVYWNGYRVLTEREIIELQTDIIIIAAQIASAEVVYNRVLQFCVQNNILLFDMYGNDAILVHQDVTKQQAFYYRKSIDEFMQLAENYDVISFDLLDTFLMRGFYSELQFYRQVEKQLKGKYRFQNFVSNRWKAKQCNNVYDIEHVYEQMQQYEGLSSTEREELAKLESVIDLKNVYTRSIMLDLYKQLKEKGKKVVFTSDWYLLANEQEKFLRAAGINDYDGLYVQSAHCGFKRSGLFRKIKSDFVECSILHVGDDRLDDWITPKMYGIDTYVIYSPFETMQNSEYALDKETLEDDDNCKIVQEFLLEAFANPFVLCGTIGKLPLSDKAKSLVSQIRIKGNSSIDSITYKPELLKLDDESNKIIEIPKFKKVDVSIIIPAYNQFEYTFLCVQSIVKHSENISYEIILADDCSTDGVRNIENVIHNITVIHNNENLKFLKNCNNAANKARGKYILFLNNDTQVQPDWLSPLLELMEQNEKIGMVGSKLVYPDGHLQEAGGILWKDGSAWNYGNMKDPMDPEFMYVKQVDYVSGASMMIRTSLWKEIGGFDTNFAPAYYEDTDLAFEVRKHGYQVVFQPKSVVVHFEGISNGTDTSTGLKNYQIVNQQKFYEKWKEVLEREHFANGTEVYLAKDRGQTKKQILVIDHYVPNYDKDSGGRCTFMYLKAFLNMGMKVTFIGDNFARPEPYTTTLNQLGVEVLCGNYYYNNWREWLKENLKYFDYIYLQRPHISIKYIDLVKEYGRGKIFYYAVDLHYIRMYRNYQITGNPESLKESENWKKIELDLFEKADVGHVVGSYEQKVMQDLFPNKPIRNIPIFIYDELPERIEKDFSQRKDILFVGGFGHTPNVDAVLWFANEIFPKLLEKYPELVWHIVGSKAPDQIKSLANENIILEGFVTDEELGELYRKCRLVVVPLRYGAGVKGKIVESAYYQIPVVTTSVGGEGIDASVGSFIMEDDADKMAELIKQLYVDFTKLRRMSDAGTKLIKRYFTSEAAERVLLEDIDI